MLIATITLKDTDTEKEYAFGSKEDDWKTLEQFVRSIDFLRNTCITTIKQIRNIND